VSTRRNFLGIPVEGDIQTPPRRNQRPVEELRPLLQAVLDDPTIVEFGWRQYTPYFNDGDPCEFSAHGLWVRTKTDGDDKSPDDLESDGHQSLGKRPGSYDHETRQWISRPYEGPDEARHDRVHALRNAIEGEQFEDVLLGAFGDHALVTVRRDGIQVDSYEHD
jgi:hypothetical protein